MGNECREQRADKNYCQQNPQHAELIFSMRDILFSSEFHGWFYGNNIGIGLFSP